mmetsp:Transcript_44224/g.106983  ORF Transcript_44224/g.106983 Transcript_44224/m.106983 type:complete len:82 (-) Transcript_44224:234-479(-)
MACKIVWRAQSPKAPDEKKIAIVNFFGMSVVVSGCAGACVVDDEAANADAGDTVAILIGYLDLLILSSWILWEMLFWADYK